MNGLLRNLTLIIFALVLCTKCARSDNGAAPSSLRNVFGEDARTSIDLPTYPLSAIGRLDSGCTGTLISPWLVLTAAHCLVDNKTGRIKPNVTYFRPAYGPRSRNIKIWIEQFWIGTHTPEDKRTLDFAIIKLAEEASGTFGQMSIANYGIETSLPTQVDLAGYSTDRSDGEVLSEHHLCTVHRDDGTGKLLHDCDSTAGVSGGALFRYYPAQRNISLIVGITVSEFRRGASDSIYRDSYSDDYANVAISASYFRDPATKLIALGTQIAANTSISGTFHLFNNNQPPPDDPDAANVPCSVGSCAINSPLLNAQAEQLENEARNAVGQAEYFKQFAGHNPHPTIGDLAGSISGRGGALGGALHNFKTQQLGEPAMAHAIAEHLPPMLASVRSLNQYITQNYAALAALDNTLKARADHLNTSMQGLERLILVPR